MLSANARTKKLAELGIVVWQPKRAKCLVLLPARQKSSAILAGMLSVLELPAAHLIRVIVPDFDQLQLASKLQLWQPQYILQLSMDFPPVRDYKLTRTFSPDHLAVNPKDKAGAYQQLLALRDQLKHDSL